MEHPPGLGHQRGRESLDFDAFVEFLKAHGHNFTLLWSTELPRFRGLPTTEASPPDFTVSPFPWMRTGPGLATDGGLKFDLTRFDQAYFDRLRSRVQALDRAGIYAGVYLFTGEFLLRFRFPTDGYPFSGLNNVNGVDDGYRGGTDASAVSSVTMTAPNAITDFQDAYVKRTIDTLNDLPNVLWIVSEEAPIKSNWWNSHLISLSGNTKRKSAISTPSVMRRLTVPRTRSSTTRMRIGSPRRPWFLPRVLRNRQAHLQGQYQRQRPQLLRDVERFPPEEPELCVGKLHERKPGSVHGPLSCSLPTPKPKHHCLAPQWHRKQAGPSMGQLPGQSGIYRVVFAQT